jgi:putative transposase
LSLIRQLDLLALSRQSYYYKPVAMSPENLAICHFIDELYTRHPVYGVRRMQATLRRAGYEVNKKRIGRLMRLMGIRAIYPIKQTSTPAKAHKVYPYLLRNVSIVESNQVWSCDITYIRMEKGFMYLFAIIDWYSRSILGWCLSNSLQSTAYVACLQATLDKYGTPQIFNTDQGSQFTCEAFISVLEGAKNIHISMDGKGRALDNVFIERFWRSIKYEYVYLHSISDGKQLYEGVKQWIDYYNQERVHQSLDYKTPFEKYKYTPEVAHT